jgi:serine/threonine protein kinase
LNEHGTDLPFHFPAHFWQTWWFQSLSLIAFALLSYLTIGFVKTHPRLIAFWKKKPHIGSGGMGIVYKAHSLIDRNQTYALKVMKDEHMMDNTQHKRFKYKMMLVDSLDHPNIVKVHERGEDKGKLYIAMEFLEGESLAQRFKTYRYPSVKEAVKIMAQMAQLAHLIQKRLPKK